MKQGSAGGFAKLSKKRIIRYIFIFVMLVKHEVTDADVMLQIFQLANTSRPELRLHTAHSEDRNHNGF